MEIGNKQTLDHIITADGSVLRWKILEIGNWNMTAVGTVAIAHGLDLTKIRTVDVIVRPDSDATQKYRPFEYSDDVDIVENNFRVSLSAANVTLARANTPPYNGADWDNNPVTNRGWITIGYVS